MDDQKDSDLRDAAEQEPESTFEYLLRELREPVSDDRLAVLAIDVLDTIRVYGGETLWNRVRHECVRNPLLLRGVHAVDRFNEKYLLLFDLLNGNTSRSEVVKATDLPLPNTSQRTPIAEALQPATLSAAERAAFLANNYEIWEKVQEMIDEAPLSAWDLAKVLLAEAGDSDVPAVGVALIEELITVRENEVGLYVLEEIARNQRLRTALSHAYLNPSERFLEALIHAVGQAR